MRNKLAKDLIGKGAMKYYKAGTLSAMPVW